MYYTKPLDVKVNLKVCEGMSFNTREYFYLVNDNYYHVLKKKRQIDDPYNNTQIESVIPHMQVLLECCCMLTEHSKWKNLNHIFCCKISFSIDPHCQCICVGNSIFYETMLLYRHIMNRTRFNRRGRHWITIWCSSVKLHVVLRARFFLTIRGRRGGDRIVVYNYICNHWLSPLKL